MRQWPSLQKYMSWLALTLAVLLVERSPQVECHAEALSNEFATIASRFKADSSLLWGPYRPNLYFGVRPRIPDTLLMGLMWSSGSNIDDFVQNLRHTCEQDSSIRKYGWHTYEPRYGGQQDIEDVENRLDLSISFAKSQAEGTHWGARIKATPTMVDKTLLTSTLIFYIGSEVSNTSLKCALDETEFSVSCQGFAAEKSGFKLKIIPKHHNYEQQSRLNRSILGMRVEPEEIWLAKKHLVKELTMSRSTTIHRPDDGNLQFVQISTISESEVDILFSSSSALENHLDMSSAELSSAIQDSGRHFDDVFAKVYMPQAPFQDVHYKQFSKTMLSNLLGGVGYFHGTSKISSDRTAEKATLSSIDSPVVDSNPLELFTAVPSRPFFPRGFLWDEGFHLQIIAAWDFDLTLEMIESWLDLMDSNGWIAREQILGEEARSKVPPEFQTQYQTYANPPTIFMVAEMLLDKATGRTPYRGVSSKKLSHDDTEIKNRLKQLYTKLQRHYKWFRSTQSGDINEYNSLTSPTDTITEGYRWRGRTPDHILTSGLDDYPRAVVPSASELHLDALCWVGVMARVLDKFSMYVNSSDSVGSHEYVIQSAAIARSLDKIHWSKRDQAYCDVTIIDGKIEHICHKGYISILPFLTQKVDGTTLSHDQISAMMDLIGSPSHLWSQFGLRSLSLQDDHYGKGENYWRSPIWVNFNYLALNTLGQLAMLSTSPHRHRARSLYVELRKNIVNTVFQSWNKTGFAWEQYNPDTGVGQRTRDFTGWTALVVRIMAMPDLGYTEPGEINPLQSQPFIPSQKAGFSFTYIFALSGILACVIFLLRRHIKRALGRFR